MDLATYRSAAETFVGELETMYYRHFAGLQEHFDIEPIYARHHALFTRRSVEDLREALDAAPGGSDASRRLAMLLDFAVHGLLGQEGKELEVAVAEREASVVLDLGGERLGFRQSAVVQANEPDADRRHAIDAARRRAVAAELNPLLAEMTERRQAVSRELGYADYRELCAVTKGLDLPGLHRQTSAFLTATEAAYPERLEPVLQRVLGFGFDRLRSSDFRRVFRNPGFDGRFPAERMLASLTATIDGLGLNFDGIVLDVESRPLKDPRAFCSPARPPSEVYLVMAPVGGLSDYEALFHESGHAQHYANVGGTLPFEFRLLGDNAITECFAFLLEHLVADGEWLTRILGIDDPAPLLANARAQKLVYLRRYCAKLAYELELHELAVPGPAIADRYGELLSAAVGATVGPEEYLSDVDPGFYCTNYLRAWALETHVRHHLVERHGPAWFSEPAAGEELRALWREGQRLTPDELLEAIGHTGGLDFGVLLDDLGLRSATDGDRAAPPG